MTAGRQSGSAFSHGHHVASPGLVRADVLHGAVVYAYDKDVAVQRLRSLIEPVGQHLVRLIKQARKAYGGKQGGQGERKDCISGMFGQHRPSV